MAKPGSAAVIIGAGPDRGLGAQLCKRFAREGLEAVVAGRTQASLDAVVADIERAGGKASSFVAEATNEANVAALFDYAGTAVDLAIYNAGNNTAGRTLEMEADYFEKSWRVVCFGGVLFVGSGDHNLRFRGSRHRPHSPVLITYNG